MALKTKPFLTCPSSCFLTSTKMKYIPENRFVFWKVGVNSYCHLWQPPGTVTPAQRQLSATPPWTWAERGCLLPSTFNHCFLTVYFRKHSKVLSSSLDTWRTILPRTILHGNENFSSAVPLAWTPESHKPADMIAVNLRNFITNRTK